MPAPGGPDREGERLPGLCDRDTLTSPTAIDMRQQIELEQLNSADRRAAPVIAAALALMVTLVGFGGRPAVDQDSDDNMNSGDRHLGEAARGGLGPEVTLFFGRDGQGLTPYVAAALVDTRLLGARFDPFQQAGVRVVTRAGVQTRLTPAPNPTCR